MKRKIKVMATLFVTMGLVVGWNLQNKQVVEALIGANTLVSRDSSGVKGSGDSYSGDISLDGRHVVFMSSAANLVSSDTNGVSDIFLKDTSTSGITRISVDSSGNQANGSSSTPKISGNGKYIVYISAATNLVSGDTNGYNDVFRYNISTGATERVSVSSTGVEANNQSLSPNTDLEGRFVVFTTQSTNLDVTDGNGQYDIVLKDMNSGSATYISQSDAGVLSNGSSSSASISCDGRYVAFTSGGSNLVSGDTNGYDDVFVTDMLSTRTVTNATLGGNGWSTTSDISCDGKYILYTSSATNQISGDTNDVTDAFRYERSTGTKVRVSLRENGTTTLQSTSGMALSADGKYALFTSTGVNVLTNTVSNYTDYNTTSLLIRDMSNSSVRAVNVRSDLQTSYSGLTSVASFSGSNKVVYDSKGYSLVSDDNNGYLDVFTVDLGPANTCIM